eukprot:gene54802-73226_t
MAKPPLPRFPEDGVLRGSLFAIHGLGIRGIEEPRFAGKRAVHIELSNQRVLVTAGAQGIGLAIAQAFVTAGSQVHICDVNAEFLATAKQILPGVSQTLCDVSREDQVQAMFQALSDRWGGLDALINNAGMSAGGAEATSGHDDGTAARLLACNWRHKSAGNRRTRCTPAHWR